MISIHRSITEIYFSCSNDMSFYIFNLKKTLQRKLSNTHVSKGKDRGLLLPK